MIFWSAALNSGAGAALAVAGAAAGLDAGGKSPVTAGGN
jgi:hypothetical protein